MSRPVARADRTDLAGLLEFCRDRHHVVLLTRRGNGEAQLSPVACAVDPDGRFVISTYPERAKARNARREPQVSLVVLSDDWDGPYVQVDGTAEVLDLPEAADDFVTYFRSFGREHPDWDEYRRAMVEQGKCLIRVTPTRWGPVATGGFPARLVEG